MRWTLKNGKSVWHSDSKYRMDWDRKAPSKGAQTVKDFLFKHCKNYIWFEEFRLPKTLLRVDYLSPTKKIAIEFNGEQHRDFVPFFHKNRAQYLAGIKRDIQKEEFLTNNGYTFIEIYTEDLPDLSKKWFLEKYNVCL